MINIIRKYRLFLFILFLLWVSGNLASCGKISESKTAEEWTTEGWKKFGNKDYSGAVSAFNNAISKDPSYAEAYNGMGWSQARLKNEDVAYNNFSIAIGYDSSEVDAYVGRAGVLLKMNLYQDAINDAKTALGLSGTYQFAHDAKINFARLHFLIAQACYRLVDFEQAKEEVDWLRSLFGLPVIIWNTSPIIIDGVEYDSYPQALLKVIEDLGKKI